MIRWAESERAVNWTAIIGFVVVFALGAVVGRPRGVEWVDCFTTGIVFGIIPVFVVSIVVLIRSPL